MSSQPQHFTGSLTQELGIEAMLLTLDELQHEDERELRPSASAYMRTRTLLLDAETVLGVIPYGSVFPDEQGGVRVEWKRGRRRVHLLVPAALTDAVNIFYSDRGAGQLIEATSQTLPTRLTWFLYEHSA